MLRKDVNAYVVLLVACCWSFSTAARAANPLSGKEAKPSILKTLTPEKNATPKPAPVATAKAAPSKHTDAVKMKNDPRSALEMSLRPVEETPDQGKPTTEKEPRDIGLDSQAPSLRVTTAGPDTLIVGEPTTYLVTLANRDQAEAREIDVNISLPPWVDPKDSEMTAGSISRDNSPARSGLLVWSVDKVAGGAQETLSLTLVPQAGRSFDLSVGWSVRQTSSKTKISVKEAKLQLDMRGPDDFVYGKPSPWVVMLANQGSCNAQGVRLDVYSDDAKLGTLPVGDMEIGAKRVVDLTLRPTKVGVEQLRVVAVPQKGMEIESTRAFMVRRAALHVEMQGPMFEYAGSKAVYTVRLGNAGNADAENVTVTLNLPGGARYVDGLENSTVSPEGVSWNVENVSPGQDKIFHVACEPRCGGDQKFFVKASTPDKLLATDSVVTRVKAVADLKLDVIDPKGARPVGEHSEYEIQVLNRGTDTARRIQIVAICSPDVEPVDVTGSAAIESGQIFFRPIAELRSEQKIVHKVTVRAHKEGSHSFRVIVQCDDPETRLASEETTRFFIRPITLQTVTKPPIAKGKYRIR